MKYRGKDKKVLPHYWICDVCATKKGGKIPKDVRNTVCYGDCKYCGTQDVMLTPIVDFQWPNGPKPIWD